MKDQIVKQHTSGETRSRFVKRGHVLPRRPEERGWRSPGAPEVGIRVCGAIRDRSNGDRRTMRQLVTVNGRRLPPTGGLIRLMVTRCPGSDARSRRITVEASRRMCSDRMRCEGICGSVHPRPSPSRRFGCCATSLPMRRAPARSARALSTSVGVLDTSCPKPLPRPH